MIGKMLKGLRGKTVLELKKKEKTHKANQEKEKGKTVVKRFKR
jgi:hypothetical protein